MVADALVRLERTNTLAHTCQLICAFHAGLMLPGHESKAPNRQNWRVPWQGLERAHAKDAREEEGTNYLAVGGREPSVQPRRSKCQLRSGTAE